MLLFEDQIHIIFILKGSFMFHNISTI